MKRIGLYSAISAAVMLVAACGGGGGGPSDGPVVTVDVPVGRWVATAEEGGLSLARQLYVLPVASGTSQAWAIEAIVPDGDGLVLRQLAFAELIAGGTALTGVGSVQDLLAVPSTNTAGPLTVTPNTVGETLQLAAGGTTWVLNRQPLPSTGTDATLWTGDFVSGGSGDLVIEWTFSLAGSTGTLTARDDAGCAYEGALTSVAHVNLPNVVRVSFLSTNREEGTTGAGPTRQQCGDWSGMGTVAGGNGGRTLWLQKSGGGALQLVSLEPAPTPTPDT